MKLFFLFFLLFLFSGCLQSRSPDALFCPQDSCASRLVAEFDAAEQSIHAAVYSFTLDDLSAALVRAKNRGVEVRVITDSLVAGNEFSDDEFLAEQGIPVKKVWIREGSMHHKFAVIDSRLVATGSFNYTRNANEKNNENLVLIHSPETARQFDAEFWRLWNA